MALLRFPCPFRLRRLAQSVGPGLVMLLGRGIFPENSRIKSFVTCPCPFQARRKYGSRQAAWALRARFSRLFRLEPTEDARAGEVPRDDRWKLLWNPVVNEYIRVEKNPVQDELSFVSISRQCVGASRLKVPFAVMAVAHHGAWWRTRPAACSRACGRARV